MIKIYLSLAFLVGVGALFGWQRFQISNQNEIIKEQKLTIQNLEQKLFLQKNRAKNKCFEQEVNDRANFIQKKEVPDENSSDTFDEFNDTIVF